MVACISNKLSGRESSSRPGAGLTNAGGQWGAGLFNHLGGYRSLTFSEIIGTSGDVFLRGLTGAPYFTQVSPVMRPAECLGPDGSHPPSYLNLTAEGRVGGSIQL